jgi:hypothetical protein
MQSDKKHLLLKYPTRQRPSKFMANLNSYLEKLSGKHQLTLVVSMDTDDILCNNGAIQRFLDIKRSDTLNVIYSYGESKGKIAAINRDIPNTPWDILVATADDMESIEDHWDDIIVQDMFREFPDLYGAINYNNDPRLEEKGVDGFKTLITLPVIGRKLYDKFGYIYHPDYKSEWCDNEQTEVFESLGVLRHINSRPIIHRWAENQDALMQHNMHVGSSYDRAIYETRKKNGFDGKVVVDSRKTTIVQISMVKNELHLLKYMLPIWKKYADGFVFMDDKSTDGTYEFLLENAKNYNILSVLRTDQKPGEISFVESTTRQRMYDEAFKYSEKIICLDADEYLDGNINKTQLIELLDSNPDTLFYSRWIQYTDKNKIRVDGKWQVHWVDRFASYTNKASYKYKQTHGEHLPAPSKNLSIDYPHLFVSHLAWMAGRRSIAVKQYHYKIWDYINKMEHGVNIINPVEYDHSVNNFNWTYVDIPFPVQVPVDIYSEKDKDVENSLQYKYIKENVKKYSIPNLNDWGFGIH